MISNKNLYLILAAFLIILITILIYLNEVARHVLKESTKGKEISHAAKGGKVTPQSKKDEEKEKIAEEKIDTPYIDEDCSLVLSIDTINKLRLKVIANFGIKPYSNFGIKAYTNLI